jgi:hypothetical protein
LQSENRTIVPSSHIAATGMRSNAASPSFLSSTLQNGTQTSQAQDRLLAQSYIIDMTQDDWRQEVIPVIDKNSKGKQRAMEIDDFDDFDENIFTVDQAFLESLDRVESEAMKGIDASKEPTPLPVFSTNNVAHRRIPQEIIEIADDEDYEDKENVPVATRHVRRRTNTELGLADMDMSGGVIDLSDSD